MSHSIEPSKLEAAGIFKDVDTSVLIQQISKIKLLNIVKGDVLLTPAKFNQHIYVVLSGELNICLTQDGNNIIARIGVGSSVGEISIIDDDPPSAYVQASKDSELMSIHRETLAEMFELQPILAVNLLKVLGERFRQNNETLATSIELQQEYRDKAERDALTGLHNRGWMDEVFPRQLELSQRIGQKVTLAMVDADHFKQVNDQYGHQVGDKALNHLGKVIQEHLRETDLLVRYGGEELVVLMPGTRLGRAHAVAERVRTLVMTTPITLVNGEKLKITISIGMAEWRENEPLEDLMERADQALYQAKGNGRNQVSTFE